MPLVGIDHIQLAMPQGQESVARSFFCDMLEMEEVTKPSELQKRGGCWFRCAGIALHLGVEDPHTPARKAHPAFLVEDLKELAKRLEDSGAKVQWDHAIPELRRFYTEDPFGNRIEMIEADDAGLTHAMPKHRMQ